MITTKQNWLRRSLSLLLALVLFISMVSVTAFAAADDEVDITDTNLKAAINQQLAKQTETERADDAAVTEAEMASLTELSAANTDVADMEGLQYAVNLTKLDLSYTKVASNANFATQCNYFMNMTKLVSLDMSGIGLYATASSWDFQLVSMVVPRMESLEEFRLADCNFSGTYYLSYYFTYDHLKKLDLSDNSITVLYKGGGANLTAAVLPVIEEIDLSGNAIYLDECAEGYAGYVNVGIEKFDFSDQKILSGISKVFVQAATATNMAANSPSYTCDENGVFDLGTVYADSVTIAFKGELCGSRTAKAEINGAKYTVMAAFSNEFNQEYTNAVLTNLADGENVFPVSVMHLNGDISEYTVKLNKASIPVDASEDGAGITDPVLYAAVMTKLKNTDYTHVITKKEMASLTGTFSASGVSNIEGIQYAQNITSLTLNGTYHYVPNLSALTKLTTLSLVSDNVTEIPDLSAQTVMKTLTLSLGASGNWSVDAMTKLQTLNVGTASSNNKLPLPAGTNDLTNLRTVKVYGGDTSSITEKLGNYRTVALTLYNCEKLTDVSGLSGMAGLAVTVQKAMNFKLSGLKNVKTLSLTFSDVESSVVLDAVGEGTNLTSYTKTGSHLVDENALLAAAAETLTSVSFSAHSITELPDTVYGLTNLTKLSISECDVSAFDSRIGNLTSLETLQLNSTKLTDLPDEAGNLKAVKTFYSQNSIFQEIPAAIFEMEALETMTFYISELHSMEGDWDNLKNLKTLKIANGYVANVPDNLKEATALEQIDLQYQCISSLPGDVFDGMDALTKVQIGTYVKATYDVATYMWTMVDEDFAEAWNKLEEKNIWCDYNVPVSYAELKSLKTSVGDIYFSYTGENRDKTIYVPKGTTEIDMTPVAAKSDSVLTLNGESIESGQTVTVQDLQAGNNEVIITSFNSFEGIEGAVNEPITYHVNVFVGDFVDSAEFPADGHTYQVEASILQKNNETKSMSAQYMSEYMQVRYKDGDYAVDLAVKKNGWLPSMRYMDENGVYVDAQKVSEDTIADTAVWRLYTTDLNEDLYISPYVVPMGYSPVCRIVFDTNKVTDITDTLPAVDLSNLNIAIYAALAITDKNNIYTDESYSALTMALEEAQKVARNSLSSQEEADRAEAALISAIDGLVVDESKLADKRALETALSDAKAIEKGNHTDTAWNALQEAIADAEAVYDTLEARQSEVDSAVKSLNTAVTLFNSSGEASTLDKNNLKDGVYSVNVDMIKTDRASKSMADNAINHTVKLEVIAGEYFVTLDFRGITIENRFGYLKNLSYYADGYVYGQYGTIEGTRIPTEVLSTQKDSDGNDVIDQYNDADNLYPDIVKIKLVPQAIADEDGYVPLHVFVPIMEAIAEGNGDQDVLMKIDWTTLKETTEDDPGFQPEEPVEQSPAVDIVDEKTGVKVHADKGVFEEGVKLVVTEITSGAEYEKAAKALEEVGKKFKLYEVHFVDENGNEVQPNGTVTVCYQIPAGYDKDNLALYRINEDGSKTLIKGVVEGDYYKVITKSFSTYALVEKDSTITDAQNTQNVNNGQTGNNTINGSTTSPQTGDNSNNTLWFMLMLASAGMLAVLTFTRKRKAFKGE